MLNPPVPMLLKSCPVALLSEILTVISADSPLCVPILNTTWAISPPKRIGRAIPVLGGVGLDCVFLSTNGVGSISKYANPVTSELPAGAPVAFPAPS